MTVVLCRTYFSLATQRVHSDIARLRAVFESATAREKERMWLRNQVVGELDDNKLVDGVTGERNVFKRRGELADAAPNQLPTRLEFVLDVSGSMYRFNGEVSQWLTKALPIKASPTVCAV